MKEFWHIPAKGKESYYHKCFMSLIWNKRKTRNPSRYCPLVPTNQMPRALHPRAWFITLFVGQECSREVLITFSILHFWLVRFLPSEVVCYVCLNENQSDNISLVHKNIALCSNLYSIVLSYVHAVHVYWVQSQKTCAKEFRKWHQQTIKTIFWFSTWPV